MDDPQPPASGPGYPQPSYPSGAPAPGVPSPRRGRATVWLPAVAVVVVVLVVAGFVVVHAATRHAKPGQSAASTGPRPTPHDSSPLIAIGDGSALLAHVVPPPAGAHEEIVEGATDGVFTADQYANTYFDDVSTAKTELGDYGFVTAADRTWDTASDVVDAGVLQFRDTNGAAGWFEDQRRAFVGDPDAAEQLISGTPDAVRFEFAKPDANGYREDVLLAFQTNLVVVIFIDSAKIHRDADVALLRQQLVDLAKPL